LAQLETYCDTMASTAAWGGQMELGALATVRIGCAEELLI